MAQHEQTSKLPACLVDVVHFDRLDVAVLAHPAVTSGVVGRYATCADEATRLHVAVHPRCPATALEVLAADTSSRVRQAARERLAAQARVNGRRPG
ncbi:hypothetical protein AB6N23_01895 [Cellulomonas sp. 179-A 9B4 NHS]|uniref:hypothetical protein n=1 Tax=Cellulomonas sp. 179-A 9B4 NHS TaxID=3142379 RepID=UPI0039A29145